MNTTKNGISIIDGKETFHRNGKINKSRCTLCKLSRISVNAKTRQKFSKQSYSKRTKDNRVQTKKKHITNPTRIT